MSTSQGHGLDYRAIAAAFSTVSGILAGFGVTTVIFVLANRAIDAEFVLTFLVTASIIYIADAILFAMTSGLDSGSAHLARSLLLTGLSVFVLAEVSQVIGLCLTFYFIGLYKLVVTTFVVATVCLISVAFAAHRLGMFGRR